MRIKPPVLADEDQTDEAELWFLPGPTGDGDGDLAPDLPPLPRAPRLAPLDLAEWQAAEAALAQELAALAHDAGRLDERLAGMGEGAALRLASAEALALGWWTGDRVAADRLALWLSFRLGATGEDGRGLARISWAARRLAAGLGAGGPQAGLAAILSLPGPDAGWIGEAAEALAPLTLLHPATRGAAAFRFWQQLDERPDHLRGLEAAILAARLGAPGRLPFLPMALAGVGGLTASGSAARRLAGWLTGTHQAVLAALMRLDRLRQWHLRASAAVAGLQGRTPPLLIGCLLRHPMVSAPQAQEETGASRAAVERNLTLLEARGLIREVTGAGRFRVWTASDG
jgi:DNA-binding MarR family transcriptional regulator